MGFKPLYAVQRWFFNHSNEFAFCCRTAAFTACFLLARTDGQVIVTIPFGNSIDFFMWILQDYNPDTLLERWIACLASVVILAFGVFLEVRAKIFLAAGEGLVNVLAFVSHKSFSLIKNCFDISLVTLAIIIAFMEFGGLHGVGLGTVAAAVLAGRIIYLYETYLHFFDKWKVKA